MENWFAGFAERYPVFPGLMEVAIESVGAGLCPRPLSREGGDCRRIRRGRPMCRPGHGFSRNLLTGGHIGPPLRGVGRCSEPTEIGAKRCLSLRGGTEPAPLQGVEQAGGGGVWSPRPTEAPLVVPSNGSIYLRHGFRQPNFVPKFGASVMGVGPYAPRGDEGRHAGSSCPTGGCGESPRLPWVAAHSGAFAPAVARKWAGNGAEITPKVSSNLGQSLSHGCAVPAPFAQGSLRGRGMRIAASLRSSQ